MDKPFVAALKLLLFIFLVGKRLRHACAGDRRLDIRVDLRDSLLHLEGCVAHLNPEPDDIENRNRHNAQERQRKPPVDKHHDDKRADHRRAGDQHILRAVVREFRDVEEIRRHAGHEFSCANFVVKTKGKLLNVRKDIPPDIRLHPHTEDMPPVVDDIQE
ncbi:hypothetical protein SDC9_129244 [bioreactor metagenome]|uniref:Uncharacterized protein n=1 Tax=bioreactor metagenome TaxID=1076179 RepID=A0A645CZ89_9ZZZZ